MPRRDQGPDGVLLLDKPAGITSTRALAAAKRLLGSRKAGHTGTLDPFATGLLPIALGEATKFSRFLLDSRKAYLATLHLGHVTTTGDPEGQVTRNEGAHFENSRIAEVLRLFMGVQLQVPPMHSAVHHQGRRLYEWAREGVSVERIARQVEIYDLQVVSNVAEKLVISVKCSKGTYIRSLAIDIGERLGCGASLSELRRTSVGAFAIESAVTLEKLESLGLDARFAILRRPESLVEALPHLYLEPGDAARMAHGRDIAAGPELAEGDIALFGPGREFLGVGVCDGRGRIEARRLMAGREPSEHPDFA